MPTEVRAPVPAGYFAECKKCGSHRISEAAANKFLSKELKKKMAQKKKEGVTSFVLKFSPHCPVCQADAVHEVELVAYKYTGPIH